MLPITNIAAAIWSGVSVHCMVTPLVNMKLLRLLPPQAGAPEVQVKDMLSGESSSDAISMKYGTYSGGRSVVTITS